MAQNSKRAMSALCWVVILTSAALVSGQNDQGPITQPLQSSPYGPAPDPFSPDQFPITQPVQSSPSDLPGQNSPSGLPGQNSPSGLPGQSSPLDLPGQAPPGPNPNPPPPADGSPSTDPWAVPPEYQYHHHRPTYTRHHMSTAAPGDPLKGLKIVCLFNNKQYINVGFSAGQIDATLCTHVNYEFAILDPKSYEMISGFPEVDIGDEMYDAAVGLKKTNPKLKVLLSLGGWEDSADNKYSELVDSSDKTTNFIEKAVKFLKDHGFDGLDFAWEFPNCWQGALGISPKDKKNFGEFLKKIRERFDKEDLQLSVSVGAIKREILAAYEGPAISKAVHHINIMAYDMHGPWEHTTGHHSQFEKKAGDSDPFCNAKSAVDIWHNLGVDRSKLILGFPTYAKTYTLSDPRNHGLNAPVKGPGRPGHMSQKSGYMCYNEICTLLNNGSWTESEDHETGFYAYSDDQWAAYDPPMMVVRKAKFVVESGAGGLLIKDLSCDDHEGTCLSMKNPLVRLARMEMISKLKKLEAEEGT